MHKQTGNFCIRCGKPRVDVKTWKEHVKGEVLIHTSTTCPDAECQKIIDKQFAAQKEKRKAAEEEREQRIIANKLAAKTRILA
jgi:hypothetical protein